MSNLKFSFEKGLKIKKEKLFSCRGVCLLVVPRCGGHCPTAPRCSRQPMCSNAPMQPPRAVDVELQPPTAVNAQVQPPTSVEAQMQPPPSSRCGAVANHVRRRAAAATCVYPSPDAAAPVRRRLRAAAFDHRMAHCI